MRTLRKVTCQDVLCSHPRWTEPGPFDIYISMVIVQGFDATSMPHTKRFLNCPEHELSRGRFELYYIIISEPFITDITTEVRRL